MTPKDNNNNNNDKDNVETASCSLRSPIWSCCCAMTIANNNNKKVQTCILFVVFIHLALLLLGRATPGFQALFFTLTEMSLLSTCPLLTYFHLVNLSFGFAHFIQNMKKKKNCSPDLKSASESSGVAQPRESEMQIKFFVDFCTKNPW